MQRGFVADLDSLYRTEAKGRCGREEHDTTNGNGGKLREVRCRVTDQDESDGTKDASQEMNSRLPRAVALLSTRQERALGACDRRRDERRMLQPGRDQER